MMTDTNSIYDVFSATFAMGTRVEELTVAHINLILKRVNDLLTESKLEPQIICGVQVIYHILKLFKDKILFVLKQTAACGTDSAGI